MTVVPFNFTILVNKDEDFPRVPFALEVADGGEPHVWYVERRGNVALEATRLKRPMRGDLPSVGD